MKYPVFSIRDNKVGFQPQLLVEQNDASAVRGFSYAVNNEGLMNYSPSDFELFKLGFIDTESGIFDPINPPVCVVTGSSVFGEK